MVASLRKPWPQLRLHWFWRPHKVGSIALPRVKRPSNNSTCAGDTDPGRKGYLTRALVTAPREAIILPRFPGQQMQISGNVFQG